MTGEQLIKEFQKIEDAFNEAVISNNLNEISKCIADEWVLVDAHRVELFQENDFTMLLRQEC